MEHRLTISEQENLIVKNLKLVRYLINKYFKVSKDEFEDFVCIGNVGLSKAAKTYDYSKKAKFSTYASTCIMNEIGMYLRKQKTIANEVSLDDPIGIDKDGNELTLRDTIPSSNRDFTDEIVGNDVFIWLISIILNLLNPRDRLIMLYKISGNTQRAIAKHLNISRSYVSRLEEKIQKELKFILNTPQQFKEVFSMKITGNSYNISFSTKDVKNFNQIFVSFLQNLESINNLPIFKIIRNKDRISILLPANLESFHFIALLMQEFDDYSMTVLPKSNNSESTKAISDSSNSSNSCNDSDSNDINKKADNICDSKVIDAETDDTSDSQVMDVEANYISDSQIMDVETDDTSDSQIMDVETDDTSDSHIINEKTNGKKVSQIEQVKDYILTKESFTSQELKQHFPDWAKSLATYLTLIKKDGIIKSTGRGQYVVVRNKI